MKPVLTISIVHFNTAEMTQRCITSILRILDTSPLAGLYEISIIDNRSQIEEYRKLNNFIVNINRKNIFFKRNCMNSGFGLGCMLTLNSSAREYLAFVNSDTFLTKTALRH